MTKMFFDVGKLVATSGVAEKMESSDMFNRFVLRSFGRYIQRDWGDTCPEDAASNDEAIRNGERILAVYNDGSMSVWIITEADRSVTTFLFPEEY